MAEENAQAQSQQTESQVSAQPTGGEQSAPVQNDANAVKAKLQNSGNPGLTESQPVERNASEANGQSPAKADGQPEANASAKEPAKKEAPKAPDLSAVFDPQELKWAQSKGLKLDGLTADSPVTQTVKEAVKMARNAESEMSRAKNEAKALEVIKQAANVPNPAKPAEKPQTRIEQFEDFHKNVILANVLHVAGVSDIDELRSINPEAYARYKEMEIEGRQRAWEEEQTRKAEEGTQLQQQELEKQKFRAEIDNSQKAMQENLLALKTKDPEVQQHLEKSGVMQFLKQIEQDAAWPVSFVMSNPKTAEFLAKAAKAIHLAENLEGLKETWRKDYDAQLKKQSEATLAPAGGGRTTNDAKAAIAANLQKQNNGF